MIDLISDRVIVTVHRDSRLRLHVRPKGILEGSDERGLYRRRRSRNHRDTRGGCRGRYSGGRSRGGRRRNTGCARRRVHHRRGGFLAPRGMDAV